jgi:hypothetical protein
MLGWDKLIPESMALYQGWKPLFRYASKPEPEVCLWMLDGIAGGVQPWWDQISAYLTNTGAWRLPTEELIPVGPFHVNVKLPDGVRGRNVKLLVGDRKPSISTRNGWCQFQINSILDHEVIVLS